MQYRNIHKDFDMSFRTLVSLHERSAEALELPHEALIDASNYYLRPMHTLVTFPHKVRGKPLVGTPAQVRPCLERLARRRVFRKGTAGRYLEVFKLWDDLETVVGHLRSCQKSSRLAPASAHSALRSLGTRVEAGDIVWQLLALPADGKHDMKDLQDTLCILSTLVLMRIDHVRKLRPGSDISPIDIEQTRSGDIATMLKECGRGDILTHLRSRSLFDSKSVAITRVEDGKVAFRWNVPQELRVRCAAHISTQKHNTISWIGDQRTDKSPFSAHFDYPHHIYASALEVLLEGSPESMAITGIEPVSFARDPPVSSRDIVIFTCAILGIVGIVGMRLDVAAVAALVYVFHDQIFRVKPPLDSVLCLWDLFDSDEPGDDDHSSESDPLDSLDSLSSVDLDLIPKYEEEEVDERKVETADKGSPPDDYVMAHPSASD